MSVAWFETRAPTDHTYVRGPAPPLGGLLAAGSPGAVRLWDMASCAVLSHMDLRGETLGATGPVVPWALCFTRCAMPCRLLMPQRASLKSLLYEYIRSRICICICISDGTLVSGDSLGRTTFWDTRTATSIRVRRLASPADADDL